MSPDPAVDPPSDPTDSAPFNKKKTWKEIRRDAIVAPTGKSGGIPEPTAKYLEVADHPVFLLPEPRPILVVMDLNGTLIFRPSKNPTSIILRPYAREFLRYCIRTFRVAIWSSTMTKNIVPILKKMISPEEYEQLVAVWGREDFGLTDNDFKRRVMCYKRLANMWTDEHIQFSHPEAAIGKLWSQANTVLIDDSVEKGRSEPYNLVRVPEFAGDECEPLFVLPQVHDYINECSRRANISAFIREQPFKVRDDFTLPNGPPPPLPLGPKSRSKSAQHRKESRIKLEEPPLPNIQGPVKPCEDPTFRHYQHFRKPLILTPYEASELEEKPESDLWGSMKIKAGDANKYWFFADMEREQRQARTRAREKRGFVGIEKRAAPR